MITRIEYEIELPAGVPCDASWGYWLYAYLAEQMPYELAEQFHEQGMTPLSQSLVPVRDRACARWTVSLLGEVAESALLPALDALTHVELREFERPLGVKKLSVDSIESADEFMARARMQPDRNSHALDFLTPTSFKSGGRYAIFPDVHKLLGSMVARWDAIAPEYQLEDEDAMRMMEERIWIGDYRLRTRRYQLKGQRIAGFTGRIWLQNRLPAPLMEIWKLLITFAEYSGVGIKTALGMGAVAVR